MKHGMIEDIMTLYVIERKIKKAWWPVIMFPIVDRSEIGISCEMHSCVWADKHKTQNVLTVIKDTYPEDTFRIKEYKRI